ncbi:hypothetical protein [Actinoplanes sp. M2I2]|uniref:hypothetical protein n=1 Tax=Actinoplanes sp. M2I2 TaxID=1734444 RepID=UPI0020208FAA|nr:hypothetical protein [Actinoplanes sp. M2I2]
MKLVYRRALPTLFATALTVGVVGLGAPALAAGAAPTGSYKLDSNAIWTGQTVTLTETALEDDDVENPAIERVISWGDGSPATTATPGETSWTHTYEAAATRTVSVALNDGTVAGAGTLAPATVAVTTPPGTLGWQRNKLFTSTDGDGVPYLTEAIFTPKDLPTTDDTLAWTTWGDGEFSLLKEQASSTTVPHWFGTGTFTPRVQYENGQGKATARAASPLKVSVDKTAPKVSLKLPASPGKAGSWSTVRGSASDSESGPDVVSLVVYKWNNGGDYVYNFGTKKWIKLTGRSWDELPASVENLAPVAANGTWASKPIAGLAKGWHFEIWPIAIDKVGNFSSTEYFFPVFLSS